ncbi:hypothetical protein [Crocosphaera sp. XPORK-15E]|uniref:hypothetical protein n=1 Tax=Crocosphaera sp. XPORK-15E TaxID=3110247 RepID=UPI002B21B9F7|nr:hypothetical protein [Crocosphaera sp. XPORK-15E]MEA5536899.1 hypothetical protein [Crocosphaera sp. XPORK-15E]
MIKSLTVPLLISLVTFFPQLAYAGQKVTPDMIYQISANAGLTEILPKDSRDLKGCATTPQYKNAGLGRGDYVALFMCPRFENGEVSVLGVEVYNTPNNQVLQERLGKAGLIFSNYAMANGSSQEQSQLLLQAIANTIEEVIVQEKGKVEETRYGFTRVLIYDFTDIKYRVVVVGGYITKNPGGFNGHNSTNITIGPLD